LHQPDAGDLRERIVRELHDFERRAREAGIAMEQLRPAHFALCATIDDVVLNTPWGAASNWASQSLLASFHPGARGPDPLSDLLRQLRRNADKVRPTLELVYLCISLGFTGQSAASQGSAGTFDRLRDETYALIATQPDTVAPALSPRWQGVAAPYQPSRTGLPVWVVAALALAACGGLFVWVSTGLNAASDDLQAQVLAAPPGHMPQVTRAAIVQPLPPAPPPPEPTLIDRLESSLKPEIDKGLVSVLGTAATPLVRVPSRPLFAANSAAVLPAAMPLLQAIAAALKDVPGSLQVIGYTDNQPIRTVQFPSNFQLSAARAQSVRAVLARAIGDAGRIAAEGRADSDPIASNATPEGREQNRRIEIVLRRQD
jgi:type VI secretion system protein ImpK